MKLSEAEEIINKRNIEPSKDSNGFIVLFEKRVGCMLESDHFPDVRDGEDPIEGEDNAWDMAKKFALNADDSIVNIYVAYGDGPHRFSPAVGYDSKMLRRYR